MKLRITQFGIVIAFIAMLISGCTSAGTPQADPALVALAIAATQQAEQQQSEAQVDPTKIALEIMATNLAVESTKNAIEGSQNSLLATQQALQATQQALTNPQPIPLPIGVETDQPDEPDEIDYEDKIKNAKILVYEDTQNIGMWVTDALDGMDVEYTHVGDAIGHFMTNLNSPIEWDLIIIAAEDRSNVQGEFWDVIVERMVKQDTAVIAEVWYLDFLGGGRISNFLSKCGVQFHKDYDLAESIYWLQPEHPLFSDPNVAMPLIHYSRYWWTQAGDFVRLAPGSDADLVAGAFQKNKSDYGLITSCMEGRVILQTFSNHDYHKDEVVALWQNYITYTLKSRFDKLAE